MAGSVSGFPWGWLTLLMPLLIGVAYPRCAEWTEVGGAAVLGLSAGFGFVVGFAGGTGEARGDFNPVGITAGACVGATAVTVVAATAVVAARRRRASRRGDLIW
jgi:hypothetical protein